MSKYKISDRCSKLADQCFGLVEYEHGGCDDNSCDIGLAVKHGYDAIAIQQFLWSGAASEELEELARQLPKYYFNAEYKRQIKDFVKAFQSAECGDCNAICRDEFERPNQCDSCNSAIPKEDKAA